MMLICQETIAVLEHDVDSLLSRWVERDHDLAAYDPRIRDLFCSFIPIGGVVIDGGAFIGDHTVAYAAKVGPTGQVWAFEPSLPALQCLYFNTRQFPQVQVISAALAEARSTIAVIVNEPRNAGANGIAKVKEEVSGLPAVALDAFTFPRVDFLKLDLEGYELRALRGAEQTIRQHRPTIISESGAHLDRYGDSHEALLAFMNHLDYEAYPLPLPYPTSQSFDVLFLPTERCCGA